MYRIVTTEYILALAHISHETAYKFDQFDVCKLSLLLNLECFMNMTFVSVDWCFTKVTCSFSFSQHKESILLLQVKTVKNEDKADGETR